MTDGTETITTLHFALMAILAVLVVIAIVAGMRRKRARVQAHRDVLAHAEEAGVQPEPEDGAGAPVASARVASPAPAPSSPPPPRTGDPAPATGPAPSRPLPDEPIAAALGVEGTPITIAVDAGAVDAGAVDAGAVDADTIAPGTGADAGGGPAGGPLTQIKGLGPKVAARLGELGIDRVEQIAALDDAEGAALDAQLGPFAGRMARDRWIEQARLLAAGDRDGFERAFGKL